MINPKVLISIATYKEAQNLKDLINEIRVYEKKTDILIINDNSNDNTNKVIKEINDENLFFLERPKKLGLGTAHKLSIFYAIKFDYDFLLTMDADFSHDPRHIPELLKHAKQNTFVIGSRFCQGGKSDYKGLRKIVSNLGNLVANNLLNIGLKEITTYFRVYDVGLLKKLPFDQLNASGYSLGVKIVWYMKKLKASLIEVPIHFKDRNKGESKIPKLQIFISSFDLFNIKIKDLFQKKLFRDQNNTFNFDIVCNQCNNSFSSLIKNDKYICLICLTEKKEE